MEMKRAAQEDTTVSAPILDLAKIFAIVIFFKFESDKKTKNVSLVQNLQCNKSKREELQKKTLIFPNPPLRHQQRTDLRNGSCLQLKLFVRISAVE